MKVFLLSCLLVILSFCADGQEKTKSEIDTSGISQLKPNIFRLTLNQPMLPLYETDFILAGHWEKKLNRQFSLLTKLGLATTFDKFGPSNNPIRYSGHIYADLDARYFFLSKRRLKRNRPILNFTGPYLSIQQTLFTNPVFLINRGSADVFEGRTLSYVNLGYQKQGGRFYFGIYAGALLWGKSLYGNLNDYAQWHGNVSIGYVFP